MLPRHQAKPGAEFASVFEFVCVANCSDQRGRDKRANPYMLDWKSGAKLSVPQTEQIGSLRQVSTQEQGREYWMIFSNTGKLVRPGDRVDVVAGASRLEGLIVE